MFQKPLFQKLRQVALTYLTWRWIWYILPLILFMMLLAAFNTASQINANDGLPVTMIFGIAMPILVSLQWFVAVAKWQFVDPRARLMPGYTSPHLAVIFAVLSVLLVLNPLLQAFCIGISPMGPLAFSLLLGGLFLLAFHFNQGITIIPAMAVFFSAMFPATSQFWFTGNSNHSTNHAALALVGAGLTAWWLWRIATLHEENEDYLIQPLGAPGSLSRLERVLQGRLEGRKAARGGFFYNFSDRWHNRLQTLAENPSPAALSQYGWGRFPLIQHAVLIALGFPLYDFILSFGAQWHGKDTAGPSRGLVFVAAFFVSGMTAAISLRSRRVRMASELLRPANRIAYFEGLFQSLAKRSLVFWLAMNAGAWVVFVTSQMPMIAGDPTRLTIGFLLLSLAVQLPAFALGLRMALWRPPFLFFLGCYVLVGLEIGLLASWIVLQKTSDPILIALLGAIMLIALGLPLLTWARNAWLRTELA